MNYIERIRDKRPLIHHITNFVSMKLTADATYAIGALPIMADSIEEVEEVTAKAKCLVINSGTPNSVRFDSYLKSTEVANEKNIPIVYDPVGVNISKFRKDISEKLLSKNITVVRLNRGELLGLENIKKIDSGIDYLGSDDVKELAINFSKKHGVITVCTGADNIITDGVTTEIVSDFNPILRDITSSGCVITSLIAAVISVYDNHIHAIHSLFKDLKDISNSIEVSRPMAYMSEFVDRVYTLGR